MNRFLALLLLALPLCALTQPIRYEHPIPFSPPGYVCYRTSSPMVIDGMPNEATWLKTAWSSTFTDITGDPELEPELSTRVKMLWDENYLYIAAELKEPHIWATIRERDAIMYQNDNFEVFIDPDGDGLYYYELEMNAHNAVWDLLMLHPYREKRFPNYLMNWEIKGLQTATFISGSLNDPSDTDHAWYVEIALPWKALKELAPRRQAPSPGEQWRINFSRVDWNMDIVEGAYRKAVNPQTGVPPFFPQENWVWGPTGYVDMHRPECYGYVQFSSLPAGEGQEDYQNSPDEQIKWALWQLFYLQMQYKKANGSFADSARAFVLPEVKIPGYRFKPTFQATSSQFEITLPSANGKFNWHMNDLGKIWKSTPK
jgi:hypothetical protein